MQRIDSILFFKTSFIKAIILYIGILDSYSQNLKPIHLDKPFLQDYSIKYYWSNESSIKFKSIYSDRNGVIKVFSDQGLLQARDGQFLFPGQLVADKTYRTIGRKKISAMSLYENQFVFLDTQTVFSNAWAGKLFNRHSLPFATLLEGGTEFNFLISDGKKLAFIQNSKTLFDQLLEEAIILKIRFQKTTNLFWILTEKSLFQFDPITQELKKILDGKEFSAFDFWENNIIIGTSNGYISVDLKSKKQVGEKMTRLPVTEITTIESINDKLWFGTTNGAFALRKNNSIDYYQGERWLPDNNVIHISAGPKESVLILTNAGFSQLEFKKMTLHEKAIFFENQVRSRHIRNGFNASLSGMIHGDLATGFLSDADNDGLWTSMYLAAEVFRYAVTKEKQALENCKESLDAMERLFTINPVPGFPSRSFERRGYIPQLADPERWQHSPEAEWDWKSTTSSDEAIGHMFAYGVMAELIDDMSIKKRSIALIDTLMSHIVKNNWYLIDYDGKPTIWGKWNPEYVNALPTNVGDRKLNASNIISMLQTAYHFTGKPMYKTKAFELMNDHGYFSNLMRPMHLIGYAPDDADDHSKNLSDAWNHSDDEMYFLGYWGLYRYAFNDTLKKHYKKAILDHWQSERPEKEGLWNIFTAITNPVNFDLKDAIWYLQEHPLDLIDWSIMNSHRKDIERLPTNFRNQTIAHVLPSDERPVQRHNANMFNLDRIKGNGASEYSAGDIWLLPYWMGRYLGVVSGPKS